MNKTKLLLVAGLIGISCATTTICINTNTTNTPTIYAMSKQE